MVLILQLYPKILPVRQDKLKYDKKDSTFDLN
jgi:hypothetical protein